MAANKIMVVKDNTMAGQQGKTMRQRYLTFKLGAEMLTFDVSQVREILDVTTIAKVPRAPEFMRGAINVQGSVVPVVDLRSKLVSPEPSERRIPASWPGPRAGIAAPGRGILD